MKILLTHEEYNDFMKAKEVITATVEAEGLDADELEELSFIDQYDGMKITETLEGYEITIETEFIRDLSKAYGKFSLHVIKIMAPIFKGFQAVEDVVTSFDRKWKKLGGNR